MLPLRSRVDARILARELCITAHPSFKQGVLNVHSLQIAYYWFMEDRPGIMDDPEIHRYFWTYENKKEKVSTVT